MNIPVFITVLFLLQIVCLIVAKKASKKLDTQEDYFLAGRGIRFFPLMMTLVATQIGGGLVLGSAEEAYRYGWYVLLYPMGACLGLLVLAAGVGKRMSQFKVSTVAQLFEVVYKSPGLKKVASLLSIISFFMILVAQVIASKKFMISMGVDQNIFFLGIWGLVILYTVAGGLKAVVATDVIQAAFFMLVFLACFAYSAFSSPETTVEVLNSGFSGDFVFDQNKLTGWLLMPLFFMVIEQDMGQRCFAAKSGKIVSWASGIAALCIMFVCFIPVYYGILGKSSGVDIANGASVLMTVINSKTSPIFASFIGCAILAAIISTADSLINAISSNVAQDFNWGKQNGNVKSSQWITCGIAIAALMSSFGFDNVVDLLILSYELSVCCLFVPVFAALFIKKGNAASATYSIVLGAAGFCLFRVMPLDFIPKELASMACSLFGYGVGELQFWMQSRKVALE
jgi:SSS family solute:Na+ symporter